MGYKVGYESGRGLVANYITKLQKQGNAVQGWINRFRAHLISDKFQGLEDVCSLCDKICGRNTHYTNEIISSCCSVPVKRERKDWISTGDVKTWLDQLQADILEAGES